MPNVELTFRTCSWLNTRTTGKPPRMKRLMPVVSKCGTCRISIIHRLRKCPVFGKLALILIWFMVVVLLVIALVQLRNINPRKSNVLQWNPTAAGILVYLMLRLCIWQCVKIKLKLKTWKLKISSLKNKLEPKVFVKAILLCLPLVPGLILTLLVSFVTYLLIVL